MSDEKAAPVVPVAFYPNKIGKDRFNLRRRRYYGPGVMPLLLKVLGRESVEEYVVASDPFAEGRTKGPIYICERPFPDCGEILSIGMICRLG